MGYPKDAPGKKIRLPFKTYKHEEKYNKEGLDEVINKYDEEMSVYLAKIGREKEVNWSVNTSSVYKHIYFPKVYGTLKEQGFENDK